MSLFRLCLVTLTLCVSCGGSSFGSAAAGGGESGTSGGDGVGGTATGASGGDTGRAGTNSSGGDAGASGGGASAGAGGANAGAGGANAGAGGMTTTGGAGAGGSAGNDCTRLKAEYSAAVEKARGCDSGSTEQCSPSSTLPAIGCGCPILVNAKSDFTTAAKQKYQAFQDAKCDAGPICNIACLEYTAAACLAQKNAAGTVFQCTSTPGAAAN